MAVNLGGEIIPSLAVIIYRYVILFSFGVGIKRENMEEKITSPVL